MNINLQNNQVKKPKATTLQTKPNLSTFNQLKASKKPRKIKKIAVKRANKEKD